MIALPKHASERISILQPLTAKNGGITMQSGKIDGRQIPVKFQCSVLPEWISDPEDQRHMRVAVDQVTVQFDNG